MARILVGLQIYNGLANRLTIQYTSGMHVQSLDYEGLPFRYHQCHEWGHLVVECKKGAYVNTQKSSGTKSGGEHLARRDEVWRSSSAEESLGFNRSEAAGVRHTPCTGPDMEQGQDNSLGISTPLPEVVVSSGTDSPPLPISSFPLMSQFLSSFSSISLGSSFKSPLLKTKAIVTSIPLPLTDSPPPCGLRRIPHNI